MSVSVESNTKVWVDASTLTIVQKLLNLAVVIPLIVTMSPVASALLDAVCVTVATVPELATSICVIDTESGDVATSESSSPFPYLATDTVPTEPVFLMVASHRDASAFQLRQVEDMDGPTFSLYPPLSTCL